MSGARVPIAFLFDVDNTLLDNDRVRRDLVQAINRIVGPERGARFWELYEEIRRECDYVDFPHTLDRFSRTYPVETGFPALADAVLSCHAPRIRRPRRANRDPRGVTGTTEEGA